MSLAIAATLEKDAEGSLECLRDVFADQTQLLQDIAGPPVIRRPGGNLHPWRTISGFRGGGQNGGGPRISIAPVAAAAAWTRPRSGIGGSPVPAGSLACR